MSDVIFIGVTIAFFAICALYVQWCDRIIGSDDFGPHPGAGSDQTDADGAVLVASVGRDSEVTP